MLFAKMLGVLEDRAFHLFCNTSPLIGLSAQRMIPDAGSPAPSNSSASTVGERADVSVQATLADGRAMLLGRVADGLANSRILAERDWQVDGGGEARLDVALRTPHSSVSGPMAAGSELPIGCLRARKACGNAHARGTEMRDVDGETFDAKLAGRKICNMDVNVLCHCLLLATLVAAFPAAAGRSRLDPSARS
jgi:hypothetical protein